jgi:hypothetical protein
MKPATSLCSLRNRKGTRRWTNVSPVTAISTDTATNNRPDTILITTNPYSYLSALGERTRIMSAKHDSLTSRYSARMYRSRLLPNLLNSPAMDFREIPFATFEELLDCAQFRAG